MQRQKRLNLIIISLAAVIMILVVMLVILFFKPMPEPQVKPSLLPTLSTTAATTTSTIAPTTVATTTAANVVSKSENPTWPTITAADGRDNLSKPYVLNNIILVNRKHPVNWDYVPNITYSNGIALAPEALEAFLKMQTAALAEGVSFYFRSGYRNFASQFAIRQQYLYSDPGGEDAVDRYSAPAGSSEHQTGLAVDIDEGNGLSYEFDQTAAGRWLHQNAYKYGFIIRFPLGKEFNTGYTYEPWHFRFVGTEIAAQFGPNNRLTLEEFLGAEDAPANWMIKERAQNNNINNNGDVNNSTIN